MHSTDMTESTLLYWYLNTVTYFLSFSEAEPSDAYKQIRKKVIYFLPFSSWSPPPSPPPLLPFPLLLLEIFQLENNLLKKMQYRLNVLIHLRDQVLYLSHYKYKKFIL